MNDTMKGNSTRWMKRKSLVNSGCDYEQKTIDKNTASINLETGNRVNKNPTRIQRVNLARIVMTLLYGQTICNTILPSSIFYSILAPIRVSRSNFSSFIFVTN